MANTVNGQTSITAAQRILCDIDPTRFVMPQHGSVLQAQVVLDTAADFVVDNPATTNANYPNQTTDRIYVVGLECSAPADAVLTLKSKVGSASAVQLGEFRLLAKTSLLVPINCENALSVTAQGGALVVLCDVAIDLLIHYVIARSAKFG